MKKNLKKITLLGAACFASLALSGCQEAAAQSPTETEYIVAEHPTLQLTQEDLDILWDNMLDPETVQIFVEGEAIDAPTPFVNREAGFVMVPVIPIAEALGYNVLVEGDEIMIGRVTILTIGKDHYYYGRAMATQLGAAPELHDDVVFVPLHFFGHVLPIQAYMVDGNISVYELHEDHEDMIEYIYED